MQEDVQILKMSFGTLQKVIIDSEVSISATKFNVQGFFRK